MSKRRDLSIQDKLKILEKYDSLPKISQREAAAKMEIGQSTLNKILKDRCQIEIEVLQNKNLSKKRKRFGKYEQIENALVQWFHDVRENDARVNGSLLKQKAEQLAQNIFKKEFSASNGWFYHWCKRENICYLKPQGEQGDADFVGAESWLQSVWPKLISQYSPSNIFNADETGLYYRALPEHTYIFKNERAKGVKTCKERITLLCCASMTGEKKEILAIGKSKRPHCFRGIKQLPVRYYANSNAWMTNTIFYEWLKEWDQKLQLKK